MKYTTATKKDNEIRSRNEKRHKEFFTVKYWQMFKNAIFYPNNRFNSRFAKGKAPWIVHGTIISPL